MECTPMRAFPMMMRRVPPARTSVQAEEQIVWSKLRLRPGGLPFWAAMQAESEVWQIEPGTTRPTATSSPLVRIARPMAIAASTLPPGELMTIGGRCPFNPSSSLRNFRSESGCTTPCIAMNSGQ
jgi:hypothetical protein